MIELYVLNVTNFAVPKLSQGVLRRHSSQPQPPALPPHVPASAAGPPNRFGSWADHRENYGKYGKIMENYGKIWENYGTYGKIWENYGKYGKIWENYGNMMNDQRFKIFLRHHLYFIETILF